MQEARILGSIVNALIAIELIIALIFLVPFSMWGFGALGFPLSPHPETRVPNLKHPS